MTTVKSIPLKIKLLNLGAEGRIIKGEERKIIKHMNNCPRDERGMVWFYEHNARYWEIKNHRKDTVSSEARDTLLAYGFLRGLTYKKIENKRYSDPNWGNIERMILKYGKDGQQKLKQRFEQWKQEAGEPAKS